MPVPAPSTPGRARRRRTSSVAKTRRFSRDVYDTSGSDTSNASTRAGSKPGSTDAALARLRSSRPADASRMTVSATSATTSVDAHPLPSAGAGAFAAGVHRGAQVRPPRPQGRQQADERPDGDRDRQREQQHVHVEARRERDRHRVGGEASQDVDAGVGDDETGESAEDGEHQVFGQHLTDEPAAARAERRAHGQLLLAMTAAREQQVGDVGARDRAAPATRRPAGSSAASAPCRR